MTSNNKTIICLHIPKTGGVSLNEIAKKQYKAEEMVKFQAGPAFFEFKSDKVRKDSIKYIQGHLSFGFHDEHSIDATYITMLRNPIDRVISNYYFILQNEKHFLHKELHEKKYSLKQYVESGIGLNTDNCQVRYLSGNVDIAHNTCNRAMLEKAIYNLDNYFSVFGVQEYYDEFLMLMAEFHGWKIPYYKKYNITKKRAHVDSLDKETLASIEQHNLLDMELYLYAKFKMEEIMKARGDKFQQKLHRFKFRNSLYQKLSNFKNKIFHR